MRVDLAQDARAAIGECPVWDVRSGRLHWVDISAGLLHRFAPADGSDFSLSVGEPIGAVGLGAAGGLVFAVEHGFSVLAEGSTTVEPVVTIRPAGGRGRMNDGRCDRRGRFWAGTMAYDYTPQSGTLYRLERDAAGYEAIPVLSGLTLSNGLDWSPDDRLMYLVDSRRQQIDIFDFCIDDGSLLNRRCLAKIPPDEGLPDGLTVDANGGIWVALFGAGRLRRYTPAGIVEREIELPVTLVTSMAFGGADLGDLYITTASHRLTPDEAKTQVHAGSVFVCRPGVAGQPANRFRWL